MVGILIQVESCPQFAWEMRYFDDLSPAGLGWVGLVGQVVHEAR